MRIRPIIALFLTLFTLSANARIWTDILGRSLDAEVIDCDGQMVTVRRNSDQRVFKLELAQFQDADQAIILAQTTAGSNAGKVTVRSPDEEPFEAYKSRLKQFNFGTQSIAANYLGVMSIVEHPLGRLPYPPRGLSIGPDGTIVMSSGNGTTEHMKLERWKASGETETIVPMVYQKLVKGISRKQREDEYERGIFWFFGGQVAHDRTGKILITLGATSANGIFRISENSVRPFKRLNTCSASSSLQVPSWNDRYAYIARGDSISRYQLDTTSADKPEVVFSIEGEKIYLGNVLMLSNDRIIALLSLPPEEKDDGDQKISGKFGIFIDRSAGGYYLIYNGNLGPMAISPDGKRMILASKDTEGNNVISEFSLRAN